MTKEEYLEHLESLHTRDLMARMTRARKFPDGYRPYDGAEFKMSIEDYKKILSTREHIPNKAERKKIRQEKAKEKQNR